MERVIENFKNKAENLQKKVSKITGRYSYKNTYMIRAKPSQQSSQIENRNV